MIIKLKEKHQSNDTTSSKLSFIITVLIYQMYLFYSASETSICSYFRELESILDKYSLKDKPHVIYNIDEKGINTEYKPLNIVAGRGYQPQTVMAEKSKTVTIIGAGNALGNQIPPFFVFPGKRMMPRCSTKVLTLMAY